MKINAYTKEELKSKSYLFETTELCEIMIRNKSDKGCGELKRGHNYTPIYFKLFNKLKDKPINLFELGVGTTDPSIPCNMKSIPDYRPGASLYGWEEFFPKAKIYGADIDESVLFNTSRIKTFYCDQTDPKIISEMWNNRELADKEFDVILEDGIHGENHQIRFFENSIHKLKIGGYYIIEDIAHINFESMVKRFQSLKNKDEYSNLEVSIYQIPFTYQTKNKSNGIVVITKTK